MAINLPRIATSELIKSPNKNSPLNMKKREKLGDAPNIEGLISNVKSRNDLAEQDLVMFLNKTKDNMQSFNSPNHNSQNLFKAGNTLISSAALEQLERFGIKSDLHSTGLDKSLNNNEKTKGSDILSIKSSFKSKLILQPVPSDWKSNLSIPQNLLSKKGSQSSKPQISIEEHNKMKELSSNLELEKNIISNSILSMISKKIKSIKGESRNNTISQAKFKEVGTNEVESISSSQKSKFNTLSTNNEINSSQQLPILININTNKHNFSNAATPCKKPKQSLSKFNMKSGNNLQKQSANPKSSEICCDDSLVLDAITRYGSNKCPKSKQAFNFICCF